MPPRHTGRMSNAASRHDRVPLAVGLDVFSVVLFIALGRRTHDQTGAFRAVIETAAPFLIGLLVAWLSVKAWRRPDSILIGLVIWPTTVLVGMIFRRLVFGEGTAPAFVIVATLFTGMCLVGWRIVARSVGRRAQASGGALTAR